MRADSEIVYDKLNRALNAQDNDSCMARLWRKWHRIKESRRLLGLPPPSILALKLLPGE
jgi:hypothetical protein